MKVPKNGLTSIFKTTNVYCKPFSIYGSDVEKKIPTGVTYTIHTAIDTMGTLIPDPLYTDCKDVMQDVLHGSCTQFSLEVKNLPAGSLIFVEYKIFDTAPVGTN